MKNYNKPISQMTPAEKAALAAHMRATILDDSDVFPGYLGNKSTATLLKPLRRPKPAPRKRAASRA